MPSNQSAVIIRKMVIEDLADALAIQSEAYPPYLVENTDPFTSRLKLSAPYCLVDMCEGTVVADLLAHGWHRQAPPPMGLILDPPDVNEVLYIHDLAVLSNGRGKGVGHQLVAQAFYLAANDGLRSAELIAVAGVAEF